MQRLRKKTVTGKGSIVIENKQVVNVCCGGRCKGKRRRKSGRKPIVKKCCFTDDVCGKITQTCDSGAKTYWHADGVRPTGTIRITNESHCKMKVSIRHGDNWTILDVQTGQQISFTATRLSELQIRCESVEQHDSTCTGTYAMALHYKV